MKMCVLGAVAAVGMAAGSATAGVNLLNNAGFESALGFDFSNPTNWNGFFGGPGGTILQAFNDTGATPHSGAQALVTTIRGVDGVTNGHNAFTGHVQIVMGLQAGNEYELAVWARSNPAINNGAEFRIEWQNDSGVELGRLNVEIQSQLTADYQRFALTSIAPTGATRAAVVFAVQSFLNDGANADTSVAWDDASLSVVPAPASLGVLAMSGLVALRRRR